MSPKLHERPSYIRYMEQYERLGMWVKYAFFMTFYKWERYIYEFLHQISEIGFVKCCSYLVSTKDNSWNLCGNITFLEIKISSMLTRRKNSHSCDI